VNLRRTLATSLRVLQQLRHDPPTVALLILMPSVIMVIFRNVFDQAPQIFTTTAPMLVGIFPFTLMFIVTSITMLRERRAGTLERLLTMPMAKLDLMLGYALAFALVAIFQAALTSGVTLVWLDVQLASGPWPLAIVASLAGLLGMAFGLFVSAFAQSEFQAIQFMPALVTPQILIGGLFVPREKMAEGLQRASDIMPMTYIIDAMKLAATQTSWTGDMSKNVAIISGFGIAALLAGAATLRRQR
jgi:ABC-2 type transport system permease protein